MTRDAGDTEGTATLIKQIDSYTDMDRDQKVDRHKEADNYTHSDKEHTDSNEKQQTDTQFPAENKSLVHSPTDDGQRERYMMNTSVAKHYFPVAWGSDKHNRSCGHYSPLKGEAEGEGEMKGEDGKGQGGGAEVAMRREGRERRG